MSSFIPFTHNLTEANGYIIYSSVPFFANNGTIIDLNSIDFSSQIVIDPSANVTLSARPMLSPSVTPDISSLPPPSSQIEAPSTTANIPATPPGTTPPATPSTSGVIIDRQTAAQLAAQDPAFARFEQILANCNNLLFGTATITLEQCATSLQAGADRWCGFEFYDPLKCEYASLIAQQYNKMVGTLGGNFFNDVFPEGLLAPTP